MDKLKIGIVGGMGPLATAELFKLLIENTDSVNDEGHIRIFIDNNPQIPDRTASILGEGQSPVPYIIDSAKGLRNLGADMILIPCNTSHFYYDQIQSEIDIPVINMIEETSLEIEKRNLKKVGILATTGTIRGKVYEKYLCNEGIEIVQPNEDQQSIIMDFIYSGVKAGNNSYNTVHFKQVIDDMYCQGAQSIILACTELCIGLNKYSIKTKEIIEPMRVLARTAILKAGYKLV